jgi:hypothetical protein
MRGRGTSGELTVPVENFNRGAICARGIEAVACHCRPTDQTRGDAVLGKARKVGPVGGVDQTAGGLRGDSSCRVVPRRRGVEQVLKPLGPSCALAYEPGRRGYRPNSPESSESRDVYRRPPAGHAPDTCNNVSSSTGTQRCPNSKNTGCLSDIRTTTWRRDEGADGNHLSQSTAPLGLGKPWGVTPFSVTSATCVTWRDGISTTRSRRQAWSFPACRSSVRGWVFE